MGLRIAWRFLRDPQVSLLRKLVLPLVLAYALSPVDLRPDWLPILGWVDDVLVLVVGILLFRWLIKRYRQSAQASSHTPKGDGAVEGEYRIVE